jgi:hypothetical protein
MSFRVLAALILPLFAIACMTAFYLTGQDLRGTLLHADALYLPTMFDDLLRGGGRLGDWYLTPAPYYFPDFPLYLLAWLLGPTGYLQIVIFAALQCGLLFYASYAIAREFDRKAALPCAAFSVVALLGLALTNQEPFVLLLSSAFHFGTFVSGILFVLAWLRFERTGVRAWLWAAFALAFITTLSDSLFMLQAALPLACAGAARAFLEPDYLAGRRRRRALPWALFGAAILGQQGYKVLVMNRTRYSPHMDLHHIGANLHDLAAIAQRLWHALPLFALCWLAFLCLALACALRLALRPGLAYAPPFGLPRPLAWLMVFWLVSTAGSLAVSLLVYNVPIMTRYFIAAICWPVLLAPLAAAHLLRGRAAGAVLAATLAGCALIGVATARQWQGHPLQMDYYPADVACVDKALATMDLHHGIAQYWDAKPTQYFSHNGMTLAHYDDQLSESRWVTSKRYFRPVYDFAVVGPLRPAPDNIPRERLEALNGKPAAEARCGGYTVLLYGPGKLKVP